MPKPVKPILPPCPVGYEWKRLPHNATTKYGDILSFGLDAFPVSAIGKKCTVLNGKVYRQYPVKYRYFKHKSGTFGANGRFMRYEPTTKTFHWLMEGCQEFLPYYNQNGWTAKDIHNFVEQGYWIEMSHEEVIQSKNVPNIEKQLDELRSKIGKLKKTFDEQVHLILMDINSLNFDLSFTQKK